jgi:type II secretory pathway component PulF
MMRVGETSGTVAETLEHLAPQFEDRARRAMSTLTMAFAGLIWFLVAGFVTYFVFRIFMLAYIGPINEALKGI